MGHCVAGQVRTTRIDVMYKSKLGIGEITLRKVFMITYEMFLRDRLSSTMSIYMIGSGRDIVDGCGDLLWQFW